jgi:DNA replication protein DnaC
MKDGGSNVERLRRTLGRSDLERMNIPKKFWGAKVQYAPESVRDVVRRYLLNIDKMVARGAGMYVVGKPGVGKTSIAVMVCKEARSCGFTAYFTPIWELRECIKSRVMFEENTSVLDRCKEVDVLVLDDLCADDVKDYTFGARRIEELLSYRSSQKLITAVTTRLDASELKSKFASLISSTRGCMVFLPVEGPDLRRKQDEELNRAVFGSD